jgi:hypothetical protein
VSLTLGIRRQVQAGPVYAVFGIDGAIEMEGVRGPADPSFAESPTYFCKEKSRKRVRVGLPLVLAWQRGKLLVSGVWEPAWNWTHTALPDTGLLGGTVRAYGHSGFDYAQCAIGVLYRATERTQLAFVPSFAGEVSLLRLEVTHAW